MSQSQTAIDARSGSPLTMLSEDEQMFRASVREFAEGELRPRVEQMDEQAKLDPALVKQCFDLGIMGIETPEEFGGAGASFFTAILAVEELSRVDASVGVFVDVQNTLVNNALIRWGTQDQKKKYLTALATESVGHSATFRSFIKRNNSGVSPSPCSMVSTPARIARRAPSVEVECAATGIPALFAISTASFSSSSVNVACAAPPAR